MSEPPQARTGEADGASDVMNLTLEMEPDSDSEGQHNEEQVEREPILIEERVAPDIGSEKPSSIAQLTGKGHAHYRQRWVKRSSHPWNQWLDA